MKQLNAPRLEVREAVATSSSRVELVARTRGTTATRKPSATRIPALFRAVAMDNVGCMVAAVVVGVVGVLLFAWWASRGSEGRVRVELALPRSPIQQLYVEGDGEALLQQLDALSPDEFVPLATALGRYEEAWATVAAALPTLDRSVYLEALLVVNAAETLSELGRHDDALELLAFESELTFVEGGRRCTRAWLLTSTRQAQEALRLLEGVEPIALYEYQCEYWLTLAYAQRTLGDLDACEAALRNATDSIVRASSSRNVEFAWAELHRARGDTGRALARYEAGAKHVWRWQGGSGLLSYGTVLAELGRHHDARAAWQQCVTQDPQSLAAIEAKQRLV